MSIVFKNGVKYDALELNRANELERKKTNDVIDKIFNYGLIIPYHGYEQDGITKIYDDNWRCRIENTTIRMVRGDAIIIDKDGNYLSVNIFSGLSFPIPNTTGQILLVLRARRTSLEKGTITLINNSKEVTGIGTEFLKTLAGNRNLVVGNKKYKIASVTNNTWLTLSELYPDLTGDYNYSVGGWFLEEPIDVEENKIYSHADYEIVFTTLEDVAYGECIIGTFELENGVVKEYNDSRLDFRYLLKSTTINAGGTPSKVFYIDGKKAMTEEALIPPKAPLNFRITNFFKYGDLLPTSQPSEIAKAYNVDDKIRVKVEWGFENYLAYDTVQGSTVTLLNNPFGIRDDNYFKGHLFFCRSIVNNNRDFGTYSKSNSEIFRIISSTTIAGNTILELRPYRAEGDEGTQLNDLALAIQTIGGADATKYSIFEEATEYNITITPRDGYVDFEEQIESKDVKGFTFKDEITGIPILPNSTYINMRVGAYYAVGIKANYNGLLSSYGLLGDKTIIKDGITYTYEYSSPFSISYEDPTAKAVATTTTNGFIVNITGWDKAEAYEIAYTTKPSGASFEDVETSIFKTFTQKTCEVTTPQSTRYYIAVRALIASRQVTQILYTEAMSGSAGIPPIIENISGYLSFDLNSIDTIYAVVHDPLDFATAQFPNGNAFDLFIKPQVTEVEKEITTANEGEIIRLQVRTEANSYNPNQWGDFIITNVLGKISKYIDGFVVWGTHIRVRAQYTTSPYAKGSFWNDNYIVKDNIFNFCRISCDSKRARLIAQISALPTDYVIKRVAFDCDMVSTPNKQVAVSEVFAGHYRYTRSASAGSGELSVMTPDNWNCYDEFGFSSNGLTFDWLMDGQIQVGHKLILTMIKEYTRPIPFGEHQGKMVVLVTGITPAIGSTPAFISTQMVEDYDSYLNQDGGLVQISKVATESSRAILRVYQEGNESEAIKINIANGDVVKETNLTINKASSPDGIINLIIDAYDEDKLFQQPNRMGIKGRLSVYATPEVFTKTGMGGL